MAKGFPKTHLVLIAIMSLGLCSIGIANYTGAEPTTLEPTISHPISALPVEIEAEEDAEVLSAAPPAPAEPIVANGIVKQIDHTIAPGDSLEAIFRKVGATSRELYLLTKAEPHGQQLHSIYPGHRIEFGFDEEGALRRFSYTPGPLQSLQFDWVGSQFMVTELNREPEKQLVYGTAEIEHSLFVASQRQGFSDALTMELAQIFQWDIDFVLDIRTGDSFSLMYEEEYLDGKKIGHGDILAAEFINQGESYKAVLYEDEQGRRSYFDPEGRNMRKAFLRAPVEFSRISSNFNLRRVHPLFKKRMPHRGIDYAATTGTPILAAGDGRVMTASRTQPNGNYLVINHGEQFQTKYLHLSRFARGIRSGAKVVQGQTIGYVGATGWATAPHLHYEFLVNGVHKNPRTVKLPDAKPIPATEQARFEEHSQPLLAQLAEFQEKSPQVASAR